MGSSEKDLAKLPGTVREVFQHGLQIACAGDIHPDAKPLKGYKGRGVLELVGDCRGATFRGVYTVKFRAAVYVLPVFKKKSTKGIATPKKDKDLIDTRLKYAALHYKDWIKSQ